jgi:uncharacterized protein YaeQ
LSNADEPALVIRDLTGALQAWIEIGAPEAARLHKAAKAAQRVVVYAHKDSAALLAKLQGERIHRSEHIEIFALDRELVAALVTKLERRMQWDLSVAERHLYLTIGDATLTGAVKQIALA